MDKGKEEFIPIFREEGILKKYGPGFHSVSEFARKHLLYAAWSDRYLCDSRYAVSRDYLDYYSLIYLIKGKMEFIYEDHTCVIGEREAILMDFRRPHYYRALTDRVEKWEVIFDGAFAGDYYDLITEKWGNTFKAHGRILGTLREMKKELDSPLPDDHTISALFHLLFSDLVKEYSMKLSPAIRKALDYINENSSGQIQINEIADYVGLSRSYFSRLFTKETGQTPYEYLLEIRINKAKQMLALDVLSVADIADQCGFMNASHFVRVFKGKVGQTPASFRNFFNMN